MPHLNYLPHMHSFHMCTPHPSHIHTPHPSHMHTPHLSHTHTTHPSHTHTPHTPHTVGLETSRKNHPSSQAVWKTSWYEAFPLLNHSNLTLIIEAHNLIHTLINYIRDQFNYSHFPSCLHPINVCTIPCFVAFLQPKNYKLCQPCPQVY